jgi:hypothetical protein
MVLEFNAQHVVAENGQLRKARPLLTLALSVAQVHGLRRTARLILTCVLTATKVLGHPLVALIQPFVLIVLAEHF